MKPFARRAVACIGSFAGRRAPVALVVVAALGVTGYGYAAGHASRAIADGTVIVHERPFTARLPAYGQVEPIALVPLRAAESGIVVNMRVVPGSSVRAGETLARLSGPEIRSLLVRRRAAFRSARTQLSSARRRLLIARRQLPAQLSTLQSIAAAHSAVAAAQARFDAARAQLRLARDLSMVRAPTAATVLAVNAGNGERMSAGQTIVTLQPSHRLWLEATYYGSSAAQVHVGMVGRFRPASGASVIPVKVAAVSAALSADGGETVGLLTTDSANPSAAGAPARWVSGERGTVTILGTTRTIVWVPTRALILDRARWWVLLSTPRGLRRQQVVPGAARGWRTLIDRGLKSGERVVVQNAFLEFHRSIAAHYTPPD